MWLHPSESLITKIAQSANTILITGRTGTGKTHLARDIHQMSPRAGKAFIPVNLATLNENLIESELFGHEKGAFSGADQKRMGKLELGNGGTILLDEIGELPARLQTKLLDALNHKSISPVGSNREIKLDVRIIAATNRDLEEMVQQGRFREDLYYRINTFQVQLPDIASDHSRIETLARDFLQQSCAEQGKCLPVLAEDFLPALKQYHWPGNVRELKNAMDFTVAVSGAGPVHASQLPPYILTKLQTAGTQSSTSGLGFPLEFHEAKEQFERSYLMAVLKHFDGRVNLTARKTKMSKVTLIDKIRRYEINLEAIKYENYYQRMS